MQKICLLALAAAALASSSDPPKLDKAKLETYLRYAEGYSPEIHFAIDDAVPSALPGFFRVTVHLSNGPSRLDRVYYASADGEHFINGSIWDLRQSPFQDTLS